MYKTPRLILWQFDNSGFCYIFSTISSWFCFLFKKKKKQNNPTHSHHMKLITFSQNQMAFRVLNSYKVHCFNFTCVYYTSPPVILIYHRKYFGNKRYIFVTIIFSIIFFKIFFLKIDMCCILVIFFWFDRNDKLLKTISRA